MNYTIYFSVCSLFYSIMLIYVVFKQKIPKTNNNSAFKALLIINFIGIIIDILYNYIAVTLKEITPLLLVMSRIFLMSLLAWIITFTLYIYSTLFNEKSKSKEDIIKPKRKAIIISVILFIISSIITIILPVNHNLKDIYSYGPAIDFVNYFSFGCLAFGMLYMFKNYKTTNSSKCAPFFAFIVGGVFMSVLQAYDPKLLLIIAVETFVMYMIYFTLDKENKDALRNNKLIYEDKEAVQKLKEEKK